MNKTVFLAEDDPMIGENIAILFKSEQISIEWVMDGVQASDVLSRRMFDAVILDYGLPGKNGYELLTEIRSRNDATPVIVTTALEDPSVERHCMAAGASLYVKKPFDANDLIARLRGILYGVRAGFHFYGVIRSSAGSA